MWKELDYPTGSILFDVKYYTKPECFEVTYFNPITNQLEVKYEDPIIDIWFLQKEFRKNKYQIPQVKQDECYPVYCKPSQVTSAIAKHAGDAVMYLYSNEIQKIYDNAYGSIQLHDGMTFGEFYKLNKSALTQNEMSRVMCKNPWVFKGDFTPDVYFRLRWINKYGEECDVSKVSHGFVDIEVDVIDRAIDPANIHDAPQPVNAVTVILPNVKICALLVLAPRPKNEISEKFHGLLEKQTEEFNWLVNHQDEFKRMIVEDDPDNKNYLDGFDIRIHIFDFKQEINLIKTVFDYINKYRPMFVLSWNAKFDDNYLMNRIYRLGYDPHDIIIPKEFKTGTLRYKEDVNNFVMKTSKDWFYTSTYNVYMCQMRLFAAIRKSQQERRSYSLSSVGKDMAGIDKLTNTKSGSFRTFAYTDFLKFLLYNVRDVVVQQAIEAKTTDCQVINGRSYMFATQYSKCFQETHIVRNMRELTFEQEGVLQACRLQIDPNIDTSFKGAFVAPTEKNAPTGYVLNGKAVNNIIYGVWDADAKAYYPSSKMGFNLDPMSLEYKCIINNQVFFDQCVNRSFNQTYTWNDSKSKPHAEDLTGPIMNTYKNRNIMSLNYNYFNMPSISDCFNYIDANL
jgi:hypothetical protein